MSYNWYIRNTRNKSIYTNFVTDLKWQKLEYVFDVFLFSEGEM